MLVLLDEQLPRRLAPLITGHDVHTVHERGWSGSKNGELLSLAAGAGFQAFVTADQNLEYQQNLRSVELRIMVLVAQSLSLAHLSPLVPELLQCLDSASPGEVVRVEA